MTAVQSAGLLHGLGGSSATMLPLAIRLRRPTLALLCPTLPGHGIDIHRLGSCSWTDWLDAVPRADVLVGQSMGANLALAAAAAGRCGAVVAINPLFPDPDAIDGLEWRIGRGHEWIDAVLGEGERGPSRLPLSALMAMHRGLADTNLRDVTCPTVVVTGMLDDVVDPASSLAVIGAITGPVQHLELAGSGHVVTHGPDVDEVAHLVADVLHGLRST
jgi:esterase/lipase